MTQRSDIGWRVVEASFETSAAASDGYPVPGPPEIAVAGRSNVGKSSLLNAFCGRRGLARVSRTPGRTRLINFFAVRLRGPGDDLPLRLVDLPGYGFAAADRTTRESFGPMVEGYFSQRATLCGLLLLVDSRRDFGAAEFELLEYMSKRQLPALVCATKIDKLKASERGLVARRLAAKLGVPSKDILLTSSQDRIGLGDDARAGGLAADIATLARGTSS
ncbi:MAG: ribosome biogenesis GTP-binding protein YihA/YsxC [Nannocystaceae bacterium]